MQVSLTFPAVLERLQLKAFDLCKLIETFVRHEPSLPRELKRHMFSIEEKMLEALAWERGSSLFPKLIMACSDSPGKKWQPKIQLLSVDLLCHDCRSFHSQMPRLLPINTAAAERGRSHSFLLLTIRWVQQGSFRDHWKSSSTADLPVWTKQV